MVVKTVIWTDTAVRERRKILNYWAKRNKSSTYSEKLIFEILARVKFLLKNPESFISTDYKDIRTSTLGHFKYLLQNNRERTNRYSFLGQ
jgi:plasmid stabilization system protein ParE